MIVEVIVLLFTAALLIAWGRWLSRRASAGRWVRVVGPVAFVGTAVGFVFTVVGLERAFGSLGNVDPAHRAQQLAVGIAWAMNGVAAVVALQLLAAITLFVATWRYHWSARSPKQESGLPYR